GLIIEDELVVGCIEQTAGNVQWKAFDGFGQSRLKLQRSAGDDNPIGWQRIVGRNQQRAGADRGLSGIRVGQRELDRATRVDSDPARPADATVALNRVALRAGKADASRLHESAD